MRHTKNRSKNEWHIGLRVLKSPTAHTRGNTGRELHEESKNSAEWNICRRQNQPTRISCPSRSSSTYPLKGRKEEDESVTESVAAVEYKEKEVGEEQMDRHEEVETVEKY